MANPVTTTRTTPPGVYLKDGFSTKVAFNRLPAALFWEIEVQPPGVEGGDPIQTSTMHNTLWRTMQARSLRTLTPFAVVCAYDPKFHDQAVATLINDDGSITTRHSDGSTLDFFGFLQNFIPQSNKEGEMPTANLQIVPTNYDSVNRVEAGPVLTEVTGT